MKPFTGKYLINKTIIIILATFSVFSQAFLVFREQNPESIKEMESRADSLARIEEHENAVRIYFEILKKKQGIKKLKRAALLQKIGHSFILVNRESHALEFLKESFDLASSGRDTLLMACTINDIGIIYEYTGKPDSAFDAYKSALTFYEIMNDSAGISAGYRNMAQILRVMGRYKEAKIYSSKALALLSDYSNYKLVANIYNEIAFLFEFENHLDSAKMFYRKLIDISLANNYPRGESAGYSNLASVYLKEKKIPEALYHYKLGYEIDKKIGDSYGMVNSFIGLADCYMSQGNYQYALKNLKEAEKLCNNNWFNELSEIERRRYEIYKLTGDFKNAMEYLEKHKSLKDTILNIKNRETISRVFAEYETEKKEQQIELLDRENRLKSQKIKSQTLIMILLLVLLLSVAMITLIIILLKNNRLKQMELEIQSIIAQTEEIPGQGEKESFEREQMISRKHGLTDREEEILHLIRSGMSNKEMAEKLFVSENTIKYHIKNIYLKLDVKNRIQAIRIFKPAH